MCVCIYTYHVPVWSNSYRALSTTDGSAHTRQLSRQSIDQLIKAGGKKMMVMVPPLSFHISTNPTDICINTNTHTHTKNNPTWCHHFPFLYQPISPKQPNPKHPPRADVAGLQLPDRERHQVRGHRHRLFPHESMLPRPVHVLLGLLPVVVGGKGDGDDDYVCTCLLPVRFTPPYTPPPFIKFITYRSALMRAVAHARDQISTYTHTYIHTYIHTHTHMSYNMIRTYRSALMRAVAHAGARILAA